MADDPLKPDKSDDSLHNWGYTLFEDGQELRRHWEGVWWENIATYIGDFWVEWNVHTRRLVEPPKPDYKVRLPINLAQPVVRTELAKLVKNRPITDVVAADNSMTAMNSAKVGDKMLNVYAERQFNMPKVRRRALHWTLMCGLGGIFVDYDETAEAEIEVFQDPKGNPVFDQRVIEAYKSFYKKKNQSPKKMNLPRGELVLRAVSPFQLIWDFSKIYLEDASWLIYSDVVDVNEAEKRWGERPEAEDDATPGTIERRLLDKMDLTKKMTMGSPKGQELCKIHRLYVKPGHPYFPNGLHLVFTKEKVLYKEPFPFEHGELPVTMMGHVPLPISQYSMSVLQQVRGPVLELSKTESQMIENRNLMANPPWLEPRQARIEGEIQNKPGLRIKYTHTPNVPPPSPVQMPDMPQYVQQLVEILKSHILEISGQGETSQGRVPPGARSGVAIAYLQEEDDTRLGPSVSEFEEMMERVNFQILQVIAEKYDIPRTVHLFRKHGEPEVFDFIGTMLDGVAGCQVQAGSALPRSKAAKQQFILDLWDRKLEQDPRKVREMLELSAGEPDEWEQDIDQAERENRKLMQGQEVEVEEWHNHPAHHYIHRQFMKSADFDALDPAIQDAYRQHDKEHERYEQQQQQQQAAVQQMMGGGGGPGGAQGGNGGPPPYEPATTEQQGAEATVPNAGAAANGQQVPEGPPQAFQADITPRSLLDYGPQ